MVTMLVIYIYLLFNFNNCVQKKININIVKISITFIPNNCLIEYEYRIYCKSPLKNGISEFASDWSEVITVRPLSVLPANKRPCMMILLYLLTHTH